MPRTHQVILAFVLALFLPPLAHAQVTADDYARAEQFVYWNAERLVSGTEVEPRWFDGERFWFKGRRLDGHEFVLVNPGSGVRRPLFDHDRLAVALSQAADTTYAATKLPFEEFQFTDGDDVIQFFVADSTVRWTCNINNYRCSGPDSVPAPTDEIASPDGAWVAFERDENLWVRSVADGEELRISRDGEADYGYAVLPEGCCQEITSRRENRRRPPVLAWSPDGSRIATHRYDERNVQMFHLLETSLARPILHSYRYALPGDSVVPTYEIYIFGVELRSAVRVNVDPIVGYFTNADSTWPEVEWSADGTKLYFTRRSRDFRDVELLVADAETGEARSIVLERQPTYAELNQLTRRLPPNWWVSNDDQEVIWFSERDGWGHLYLYDATTGRLKNRITEGSWLVLELLHVDEDDRWVYLRGVGREEGRDPYHAQLYRAKLDGSAIELLAPENAHHVVTVSPSARYMIDTYSRGDTVPVTVVRDLSGQVVQTIERGDASALLDAGWEWPVRYVAKGRDGVTDVYGYLYFPPDMDESSKYPVIDYVYPGPQIGPVREYGFNAGPRGQGHALAELGFIVFTVDAFGTPFRSKEFHDAYYGNMGDNGLPDHIAALEELSTRYPQMDLDRVGIFGHSGGGFASTDAILRYPDFFKVAVSGAGNHDNRGYHFPWAEKYQGLLETDAETGETNYDSQANQNLAANLTGKLMLTYGSLDDNVHPNMTLLVVQQLIEHNKDFDMLVLPNRNHGYAREPYLMRRTWDYFVRHLLGVEPPKEYLLVEPEG